MKPMLAKKYTNQDIDGWLMSEKLDGVRAFWNGIELRSRNDKPIVAPAWFLAYLPKNLPLDGELHIGRGMFQQTVSAVRKKTPVDSEWERVLYKVFDAPYLPGAFANRIIYTKDFIDKNTFVDVLRHVTCFSKSHMELFFDGIVNIGGEGLILRHPESGYEEKRSKYMLKVKPIYDSEAIVIGHTEGEGKYIGMLGALIVEWKDKKFQVGSGLTDADRSSYIPLGSIVTFKYQGLTDAGIPRFPIYISRRNYE